ncbi:MAG: exosome complex RNA-binding protein Csl4 [Candidatus Methanomethylicia archaeon]
MKIKHGDIVIPGDILGTIEEWVLGENVYEFNGEIISLTTGYIYIDKSERKISVKKVKNKPLIPKKGDVIRAIVNSVRSDFAQLGIFEVNGEEIYGKRFSSILHIINARHNRSETLHDLIKAGDIIEARVLNSTVPYQLTIKEPELGVILALCVNCRSPLKRIGKNQLFCIKCGLIGKRRISINYIFR